MTTYTLSKTSPVNTILMDPGGNVAYEVSTPLKLSNSNTTIRRGEHVVATVQWKIFEQSTITMNGMTTTIKEAFPTSKKLSTSRIWTMPNGNKFKWKGTNKLYCVSLDTGLSIATYNHGWLPLFRSKPSTLDVTAGADTGLTDALIVTWVIAGKKASDRAASSGG